MGGTPTLLGSAPNLVSRIRQWVQSPSRQRACRDGLSVVGLAVLALILIAGSGSDALSYWDFRLDGIYAAATQSLTADVAFRYAPPVAFLFAPFHVLPWEAFRILWVIVQLAALWMIARSWTLAAVAVYPVALELSVGNVHLLLALAIYLGLRYPVAWSWLLLTKVTPGVGLLWFAARRQWRPMALALGSTLLIGLATWLVRPDLWADWLVMLSTNAQLPLEPDARYLPVPLAVRLPLAAGLVVWAARRDDPRWLGLAATLGLPTIWPHSLSMLILCFVPLTRWRR